MTEPLLIDPTKPEDSVPAVKGDLRDNLKAMQLLSSGRVTPKQFAPTSVRDQLGRAANATAAVRLSDTFGTEADAITHYDQLGTELTGADLSLVTHDWAAVQQMSKWVETRDYQMPQYVDEGRWYMSDTWKHLQGAGFGQSTVIGAGMGYGSEFGGTIIDCTLFNDKVGIAVSGARSSRLMCMGIHGGNAAPASLSFKSADINDWLSPGVSNSRHSPYCGFAVDPYSSAPVAGGYGNDPYNRTLTTDVALEDVHVSGFAVGLGSGLSNSGSLGDSITAERVFLRYNTVPLVSGGSQNRGLSFTDGYLFGFYRGLDNRSYGTGDGNSWVLRNVVAVIFYELFSLGQVDPVNFENIHMEQFTRLGAWGAGPQSFPMSFRNCHIKPARIDASDPKPPLFMQADGPVVFDATRFDSPVGLSTPPILNIVSRDTPPIFNNRCTFYPQAGRTEYPYLGYSDSHINTPQHHDTTVSSVQITDGVSSRRGWSVHAKYGGGNSGIQPRVDVLPCTEFVSSPTNGLYRYEKGDKLGSNLLAGISNVTYTTTSLVFDTPEPEYVQVGDAIKAECLSGIGSSSNISAIIAVVTSKSSNTITCEPCADPEFVADPLVGVGVVLREWAPKTSPEGTASTSSEVVGFASSVSNIFKEGDPVQGDTGTWTRYRVVSIAGDGLSITLNKNAPITGTVKLFWGRLYEIAGVAT